MGIEEQLGADEASQQGTFGRDGMASDTLVDQQCRARAMDRSKSVQHIWCAYVRKR